MLDASLGQVGSRLSLNIGAGAYIRRCIRDACNPLGRSGTLMFISPMFQEIHGSVESISHVTPIIKTDSAGVVASSVHFMTSLWHIRPLEATGMLSHTHTQSRHTLVIRKGSTPQTSMPI